MRKRQPRINPNKTQNRGGRPMYKPGGKSKPKRPKHTSYGGYKAKPQNKGKR